MSICALRLVICWMLIAFTPASLVGADVDPGGGMLWGKGKEAVLLNGKPLPRSSAVFPGDLIQTPPESVATIDAPGSGITVFPGTLIKFEQNAVSLEYGSVSVATSERMVASARQVSATPASSTWTEFEMVDVNGSVRVFATKGGVSVNCGKENTNLTEGDMVSPDESGKCNKKQRKDAALLPAQGGLFTNPYIVTGAGITFGGILCLLLCPVTTPFISQFKP